MVVEAEEMMNSDCSTTMMARFVSVSSAQFHFSIRDFTPPSSNLYPRCFEVSDRRFPVVPIKCSSSEPEDGEDSAPSLSSSASSSTSEVATDSSRYKYNWYTGNELAVLEC